MNAPIVEMIINNSILRHLPELKSVSMLAHPGFRPVGAFLYYIETQGSATHDKISMVPNVFRYIIRLITIIANKHSF